jgi:hypothetical protein
LYDKKDRDAGFIETLDRQGNTRKFPIIAVPIGIATNRTRSFTHFGEMTEIASEMKKLAKQSWEAATSRTAGESIRRRPDGR